LSELRRREPEPAVVAWLEERPATTLYLSVLTLGVISQAKVVQKSTSQPDTHRNQPVTLRQ